MVWKAIVSFHCSLLQLKFCSNVNHVIKVPALTFQQCNGFPKIYIGLYGKMAASPMMTDEDLAAMDDMVEEEVSNKEC